MGRIGAGGIVRKAAFAATLLMAVPVAAQTGQRCSAERGLASIDSNSPTRLTVVNAAPFPIRLFWIDFEGRRRPFATVQPGRTHRQPTFASHPWVIADMAGNCRQILFAESREQNFRFDGGGGTVPGPVPRRRIDPPPFDGPDTVEPLNERDAGRRIDVPIQEEITVALPSNGSTGFYWDGNFATNVRLLGVTEERPEGAAIGAGGTALVRLLVMRRGPAEITLMYLPPGGGRSRRTLVYRFQGI